MSSFRRPYTLTNFARQLFQMKAFSAAWRNASPNKSISVTRALQSRAGSPRADSLRGLLFFKKRILKYNAPILCELPTTPGKFFSLSNASDSSSWHPPVPVQLLRLSPTRARGGIVGRELSTARRCLWNSDFEWSASGAGPHLPWRYDPSSSTLKCGIFPRVWCLPQGLPLLTLRKTYSTAPCTFL